MKKPVKKTELVEVEYWDCGICQRRHKSERAAQNCILKSQGKPKLLSEKLQKARDLHMTRMVVTGATYFKVGHWYGLSSNRAQQIVKRTLHKAIYPEIMAGKVAYQNYTISEVRDQKDSWLDRLDILAKEW